MRYLSSPLLRRDPRNHLIREWDHPFLLLSILTILVAILGLIEIPKDDIAFIVMEEWSPQLVPETPCSLRLFLGALRQCIEVSTRSVELSPPMWLNSPDSTPYSCILITSPTSTSRFATYSRIIIPTMPTLTSNLVAGSMEPRIREYEHAVERSCPRSSSGESILILSRQTSGHWGC